MQTVLLVAFHFPPFKGSSGLERTLGFCRGLPRHDWRVAVLTAHPRAYASVSNERIGDIPAGTVVHRAFALDAARHLTVGGRYLRLTALPDRWVSWLVFAVAAGWRMCRRERACVVWSTYPIATAHLVGYWIAKVTKKPWVADFRDPMVERDERTGYSYPSDDRVRGVYLKIERRAAEQAAALVFCTKGAAQIFQRRHPSVSSERIHIIPNGFDETAFADIGRLHRTPDKSRLHLLHSGVLYPGPDRDPVHFLRGVRMLLDRFPGWGSRIRITLRATGYDDRYRPVIESLGLTEIVQLAPVVSYRQALAEMMEADALLVFQGHTSNPAIPAKIYEYFRAMRPILAMVDEHGDTADLLRAEGVGRILPIEDATAICEGLGSFLSAMELSQIPVMSAVRASHFERGVSAARLAAILQTVAH